VWWAGLGWRLLTRADDSDRTNIEAKHDAEGRRPFNHVAVLRCPCTVLAYTLPISSLQPSRRTLGRIFTGQRRCAAWRRLDALVKQSKQLIDCAIVCRNLKQRRSRRQVVLCLFPTLRYSSRFSKTVSIKQNPSRIISLVLSESASSS